jgi:hypothetical protein
MLLIEVDTGLIGEASLVVSGVAVIDAGQSKVKYLN